MKKYILKYKANLILAVIFGILEVIFIYLTTMKSSQLVNIFTNKADTNVSNIILLTLFYIALSFISNYILEYNRLTFASKIASDLRYDYFDKLFSSKSSSYYKRNRSDYITDIDQNIDQLRLDYLLNLPYAITGIGQVIVYLVALYNIHPYILITTMIFVVFPAFISKIFSRKLSELQIERSGKNSSYINRLYELLDGYLVIKESGNKKYFIDSFDKKDEEFLNAKKRISITNNMLYQSMFSLNLVSYMLIILIGSFLVERGQIELSNLIASLSLVSISTNSISEAFRYVVQIISSNKLKDLVINSIPYDEEINNIKEKPELTLSIKNLSFDYNDVNVFSDLNIDLENNKKYAIIGNSGSGKSTLAKILMKINDNYKGSMEFINGNYLDFNEKELYSLFYYIPQNPIIFKDSLINNIVMDDKVEDLNKLHKIIDKVKLSYLYNKKVDDNIDGNSVSGGEKKKIELARALYNDAKAIIFDEPTSGLDPNNGEIIENLIDSLDDVTRIVITHNQDPNNLKRYDEIIDIEKYKIR